MTVNGVTSTGRPGEVGDDRRRRRAGRRPGPARARCASRVNSMNADDVGGQEVLALADPDDQRGVAPRGHEPAGLVGADRHQRERPGQPLAGRAHGVGEVPGVGERGLQQVRHDLGVGLRGHHDPALGELGSVSSAKFSMIPLWMTATRPPRGHVRVGVDVGRPAVRGPPGVPDPRRGGRHRVGREQRPEVRQLAGLLAHRQLAVGRRPPPRRSRTRGTPGACRPATTTSTACR